MNQKTDIELLSEAMQNDINMEHFIGSNPTIALEYLSDWRKSGLLIAATSCLSAMQQLRSQMQQRIDELQAEYSGLKKLTDELQSAFDSRIFSIEKQNEIHNDIMLYSKRVLEENQRLKQRCEELEKYVRHKDGCEMTYKTGVLSAFTPVCTCGLDNLINNTKL